MGGSGSVSSRSLRQAHRHACVRENAWSPLMQLTAFVFVRLPFSAHLTSSCMRSSHLPKTRLSGRGCVRAPTKTARRALRCLHAPLYAAFVFLHLSCCFLVRLATTSPLRRCHSALPPVVFVHVCFIKKQRQSLGSTLPDLPMCIP